MINSAFLNKDRNGTGGLLFIIVSSLLACTMILSLLFIKASTARSVAESVEHTMALQCLASCYTNPKQAALNGISGGVKTWNSSTNFVINDKNFNPYDEFQNIMKKYRLMSNGERGHNNSGMFIKMKYNKNDNVVSGRTHPSFEIQIGNWGCYNNWWDRYLKITPNPVKVTIEDNYQHSANL